MRNAALLISLLLLAGAPTLSPAQVNVGVGIALPGLQIGINVPSYPQLVRVPDYPVYYAPGMQSNYFFYDGVYWVYRDDQWYASDWYNGPWNRIAPTGVPLFVLRIPVRYYRSPPRYFAGWPRDAPPRWGDHWGNDWQHQRKGWDQWDHRAAPRPAPLPGYQRQYPGDRYPQVERQRELHNENYRHQPREAYIPPYNPRQSGDDRGHANPHEKDGDRGEGNGQGQGHGNGQGKGKGG